VSGPEGGAARAPLIAGNWKMYKTQAATREFVAELVSLLATPEDEAAEVEVAVCAPFTDLSTVVEGAEGSLLQVFAQNMHYEREGAYTGEISVEMLDEIGVHGVVLGHSERRTLFGESDRALALKVPVAIGAGLQPILCVGETEEQRASGETERTLRHQIGEDLAGVTDQQLASIVIAYEPVWAIGTGNVATTEQAQEASAFIRALIAARDTRAAERVQILYGGSVKPENAAEVLALPDVDGALVGGASLDPQSFMTIVNAVQ
jgi:triosephosphate isomerase (TIM)